ncbi:hypothetical protein KZZ52_58925 [Dactylosporangium sp. AC04546]|uniref:hypothetical protein n=1 Tax=Dactylosporangium sp. AC04546 TaxID=2862460 RepID=UPI001EE02357|nr:hypothetical protein [Dactylosporangium sp. AC04546]WVK83666.1 hypothetical protein KZZ52_58925 [Dactylosporangium sp. AC04546]
MKYRLVTRSDFDGLVCAVLLRHLGDITFVHPKDVQDGTVEVGPDDAERVLAELIDKVGTAVPVSQGNRK